MGTSALEFEKPIAELEKQIDELKRVGSEREIDVLGELTTLEEKLDAFDVAAAALFLLSPAAETVTGAVLDVWGGTRVEVKA